MTKNLEEKLHLIEVYCPLLRTVIKSMNHLFMGEIRHSGRVNISCLTCDPYHVRIEPFSSETHNAPVKTIRLGHLFLHEPGQVLHSLTSHRTEL